MPRYGLLLNQLRAFNQERNWEQFHSPKNLTMALQIEAGELAEHFLWLSTEQSREVKTNEVLMAKISDEVADVMAYLMNLCDQLDIDPLTALENKIPRNAAKYPVEKVKRLSDAGQAKKYSEL